MNQFILISGIAVLAFIGMVSSGADNAILIILSIVSGLLSFIPLCLIIGYCFVDSKDK